VTAVAKLMALADLDFYVWLKKLPQTRIGSTNFKIILGET
jgi:hypothetical protein